MLSRGRVHVLAAGCLIAPGPAHAISGQLILSCKDQNGPVRGQVGSATHNQTFLIFDFTRDRVFDDRTPDGTPITDVKASHIAWKSDDGTRVGFLNGATLQAVEQGARTTTYECTIYARLP